MTDTENLRIRLGASGALEIEIPSVLAEGRSHFVEIPFNFGGLSILKKVLRERQAAIKAHKPPTIGSNGSPVASQIQQLLETRDREDRIAAKKAANDLLSSLGIDDITLEL
jgi:hypothetical protein